ncbi:TlyA family RNA methyltransferase [Phenylobacterium terrae]|uniref:TlyA family RNA methyltransferase n=1 Tax=Phenylobacterium terrae TaxID=2665495 RepID=A0ABW4N665_9CAUL
MEKRRADVLLVERGLFESRAKARAAIEAGRVFADGRPVARASDLIAIEAQIAAEAAHPWVGRGALKLVHALDLWPIAVGGRVVLDVGASTGGFTEVCLARGAARVYAVDVGQGQLHPRLAADPRVVSLEGVDARRLDAALVPEAPELVVCDASFIGLSKVLPVPLSLAAPGADLVALVKPQFEAGPGAVGKGGLVKDPAVRAAALEAAKQFFESSGWRVRGEAESPIAGGEGNLEFLVWARKGGR